MVTYRIMACSGICCGIFFRRFNSLKLVFKASADMPLALQLEYSIHYIQLTECCFTETDYNFTITRYLLVITTTTTTFSFYLSGVPQVRHRIIIIIIIIIFTKCKKTNNNNNNNNNNDNTKIYNACIVTY